jgi:hypothetical protein
MMLRHLGIQDRANDIQKALEEALAVRRILYIFNNFFIYYFTLPSGWRAHQRFSTNGQHKAFENSRIRRSRHPSSPALRNSRNGQRPLELQPARETRPQRPARNPSYCS